eukprot:1157326-Pelagomonas_calceolata.AAC.4
MLVSAANNCVFGGLLFLAESGGERAQRSEAEAGVTSNSVVSAVNINSAAQKAHLSPWMLIFLIGYDFSYTVCITCKARKHVLKGQS